MFVSLLTTIDLGNLENGEIGVITREFISMINDGLIDKWVEKENYTNFKMVKFDQGTPKIVDSVNHPPVVVKIPY